jgi:hypothetical protein
MNRRQMALLLASGFVLGGLSGCCCKSGNQAGYLAAPRPGSAPACDRCAGNGPLPPRFVPNAGAVVPGPNPAGPIGPPPGPAIQQNGFFAPAPPVPPGPAAPAPGVRLEQPEPMTPVDSGAPRDSVRPYTPQSPEPPTVPQRREDRDATPALPVDIPRFAIVKPRIAGGNEPYPEGVKWLSKRGYRAALHLRAPGEDDTADRRLFEQNGLRYLSLQVSPQTLSRDLLEEFNRLVGEANNLPLFVYDKDSTLAGGLWYLHFRVVDKQSDEKAREEAEHLGFKQSEPGPSKTMWIAVQKLLAELNP